MLLGFSLRYAPKSFESYYFGGKRLTFVNAKSTPRLSLALCGLTLNFFAECSLLLNTLRGYL